MKIAVGSKNPVKVKSVENVLKKIWPEAIVEGVEVEHGTCDQPTSNEEAVKGAISRAKLSLEKIDADYGFGLEGTTFDTEHGMFLEGWVVVINKKGEKGISSCGSIQLPEKIASEVRKGKP